MSEEKYMVDVEKVYNEIEKDGVPYIEETVYRVFNDGTKEVGCTACYPKPSDEPVEPELTQLDRIEAKIQTNEDLQTFYDDIVREVGL